MEQQQFEQLMQRLDSLENQNKDIKKRLNLSKAQNQKLMLWIKAVAKSLGGEAVDNLIRAEFKEAALLN
jgi:hypothetical protein